MRNSAWRWSQCQSKICGTSGWGRLCPDPGRGLAPAAYRGCSAGNGALLSETELDAGLPEKCEARGERWVEAEAGEEEAAMKADPCYFFEDAMTFIAATSVKDTLSRDDPKYGTLIIPK